MRLESVGLGKTLIFFGRRRIGLVRGNRFELGRGERLLGRESLKDLFRRGERWFAKRVVRSGTGAGSWTGT